MLELLRFLRRGEEEAGSLVAAQRAQQGKLRLVLHATHRAGRCTERNIVDTLVVRADDPLFAAEGPVLMATDPLPVSQNTKVTAQCTSLRVRAPRLFCLGRSYSRDNGRTGHAGQRLDRAGPPAVLTETFDGNGRTCGTCHPADNNYTLDPAYIARLPANDPLFVAEHDPASAARAPTLLRKLALVVVHADGFGKPACCAPCRPLGSGAIGRSSRVR